MDYLSDLEQTTSPGRISAFSSVNLDSSYFPRFPVWIKWTIAIKTRYHGIAGNLFLDYNTIGKITIVVVNKMALIWASKYTRNCSSINLLIFIINVWGNYFSSHFTDENSKKLSGEVIWPSLIGKWISWGWNSGILDSKIPPHDLK